MHISSGAAEFIAVKKSVPGGTDSGIVNAKKMAGQTVPCESKMKKTMCRTKERRQQNGCRSNNLLFSLTSIIL